MTAPYVESPHWADLTGFDCEEVSIWNISDEYKGQTLDASEDVLDTIPHYRQKWFVKENRWLVRIV